MQITTFMIFSFPINIVIKDHGIYYLKKMFISVRAYKSALEDNMVNILPFDFFLTLRTIIIYCFQKSSNQRGVENIF